MPEPRPSRHRGALLAGSAVALAAVLLLLVGPASVADALTGASPRHLALGFVCYALFFVLRGARWKLLLRSVAPDAGLRATTSLTATGWLVSSFVPFKAGDVTRAALLARHARTSFFAVGGSVVLERALDAMGLAAAASLALLLAGWAGWFVVPGWVVSALLAAWALPLLGLAALLAAPGLVPARWRGRRLVQFALRFAEATEALRREPRVLPALLLLSALVVLAQVTTFALVFLALEPSAPAALVLAGVPLFVLTFAVALLPGHVGTYEAGFVAVFALLGFDAGALLPMAVAAHVLSTAMVVMLGAVGFAAFKWGGLVAAPTHEGPPPRHPDPDPSPREVDA